MAALACGGLALFGGCGAAADEPAPEPGAEVSVTDWTDTEITLDRPAERIVCLDGSCLDALAELELTPVASAQQESLQSEAFFGPDAGVPAIEGTFFEPDLEGILAAEPDLVIGSAQVHGELREALGDIPLYAVQWSTDEDAVENLHRVATLTDRLSQAEEAEKRYRETLAAYGEKERPRTVLSMYGGATDDIGIDAADSTTGHILGRYTAYPWPKAKEGESGFLEIGLEDILRVDPEVIYVLDFGFDPDKPPLVEQLAEEPVWGRLQAVRNDQVIVTEKWWGTTTGTRTQQLILDTVLPTLYPEEFPEPLGPMS